MRDYTKKVKFTPIQVLTAGYLVVTLFFAFLLMLPVSSKSGKPQGFIDALFMATSGISTCGLGVVDVGSYYSFFGQIVLMLDFQVGGIGYMAFFVFVVYLLQGKISLNNHLVASESIAGAKPGHNFKFFSKVIAFTFIFELLGGVILCIYWLPNYPFLHAFYLGIFHSIAAFCTAGFSLFPDSIMSYKNSVIVNVTINFISLAGGIGFFVLNEIYMIVKKALRRQIFRPLSVHGKLAIIVTVIVIGLGAAVIFVSEKWPASAGIKERLLVSSFQSVSASTTDGYNSIDIGAMSSTGLFMLILLMFIGASPGSTGGGIKTTTLGVIFATTWSKLKGEKDSNLFGRRISNGVKDKAFLIFFMFIMVAIVDLLVMTSTEKAGFMQVLFEIISALGNTGLSTGVTASLSVPAKILLSITMFIGRVGPLTLGLAMIEKPAPLFRYPESEIFVG